MQRTWRYRIFGILAICLLGAALSSADEAKPAAAGAAHVMLTGGDLKWMDGPPSLPPGARFAAMEGNAKDPGPFTMRLKFPANYRIPAHSHPADEHVTVISGTFYMGVGDKLNEGAAKELPAGSFALMPAKHNHFALTKGETVVQLHGIGPWGINYVNPTDDPRKAASK